VEVVADTADLLVVNKPSTVPMHPCGAYRYNSLFHILDRYCTRDWEYEEQRVFHKMEQSYLSETFN
jgi:23S rRNA-/tRNA-specific pseudouridylate synthase